jgi:hypothetical protein
LTELSVGRLAHLRRYAIAALGPIASAAAQFLLSFVLLRRLPADQFGEFSFLFATAQFSAGIWSALLCAPLPIVLRGGQGGSPERPAVLSSLWTFNLLGSIVGSFFFVGLALLLGTAPEAAILFGVFAGLNLLRWFARTFAYTTGSPTRTTVSDALYSAVLLSMVGIFFIDKSLTLTPAYASLALGSLVGLGAFGRTFFRLQFTAISLGSLASYADVWRRHAKWSLLGVVTTEATANAHVYIVTAFGGPTVFAPIAASALLIRPVQIAMNALGDYERTQMARQVASANVKGAVSSVRIFRRVLIAAWCATALAAALLMAFRPRLLFPARYSLDTLTIGVALWMAVALVRSLRVPESSLLQGAGEFRALAFSSVWSCGVSIVGVLLSLALIGPVWSIVGILIGEALFAAGIWRQARNWLS